MFFLLVILKVPVIGMIYLLWWAAQPPELETAEDEGNGSNGRHRPLPRFPRGPRRDPHGGGTSPVAEVPHEGRIRQPEPARALDRSREIVRK